MTIALNTATAAMSAKKAAAAAKWAPPMKESCPKTNHPANAASIATASATPPRTTGERRPPSRAAMMIATAIAITPTQRSDCMSASTAGTKDSGTQRWMSGGQCTTASPCPMREPSLRGIGTNAMTAASMPMKLSMTSSMPRRPEMAMRTTPMATRAPTKALRIAV